MLFKKLLINLTTSLIRILPACHNNQPPCRMDNLTEYIDKYLEALATHNPERIPLDENVLYTENGHELEINNDMWT